MDDPKAALRGGIGALALMALLGWAAASTAETGSTPQPREETAQAPASDAAAAVEEPEPEEPEPEEPEEPEEPVDTSKRRAAGDMTEGIEEIVITGVALEDALQNEPVSSTSFGGEEIKALRIRNIEDLADYTPNLEINTAFAASNPTLFIRGIGLKDYNANAAGAVAIYQDGVNINSPAIQLFQLFDVDAVHVLRGPQGSVNGRNATAGAIMVNSILPDGEFDVSGSFSYGNLENYQAEGAISLPLVDQLLSARMAFTLNLREGYTTNRCAGWNPEVVGRPALSETTIRQAWEDAGRPTTGNRFPGPRSTDAQGRPLVADDVCILRRPGRLDIGSWDGTGEPEWIPENQPHETVESLSGLKWKLNDVNNWAARSILRLQPDVADGMDWILNLHGGRNRSDSRHLSMLRTTRLTDPHALLESIDGWSEANAAELSGFEGVKPVGGFYTFQSTAANLICCGLGGSDPYHGWYNRDGVEDLDTWGLGLKGQIQLGPFLVTTLTGYEWYNRFVEDEGDATPANEFPADYDDKAWQVSQELRAEYEGDGYRWSVGGFFLHETLDAFNKFVGILGRTIDQRYGQELFSLAPYANGRFWITETVNVDAGIRYNWERKDYRLEARSTPLDEEGFDTTTIPEETRQEIWTGVTGGLTLNYAPVAAWMDTARVDTLNLYAKYGRGMKGGHFNASLTLLPQNDISCIESCIDPVEPEFIHSIELGMKSRWLDDRVVFNLAAFRYWYEDLQVFDIDNQAGALPIQKLLNGDARVWGAEVDFQIRPLEGLSISGGAGWLNTEFVDFVVTKSLLARRQDPPVVVQDHSGNPLIAAPEWSLSTIVEWEIPLFGWGSVIPQYDFSWRSKIYLDPQKLDPISQDPYWLHNARLAYRTPDGRIEIAGWVQNLLDERYKIDVFDLSLEFESILEVWSEPRTYGLTISYNW